LVFFQIYPPPILLLLHLSHCSLDDDEYWYYLHILWNFGLYIIIPKFYATKVEVRVPQKQKLQITPKTYFSKQAQQNASSFIACESNGPNSVCIIFKCFIHILHTTNMNKKWSGCTEKHQVIFQEICGRPGGSAEFLPITNVNLKLMFVEGFFLFVAPFEHHQERKKQILWGKRTSSPPCLMESKIFLRVLAWNIIAHTIIILLIVTNDKFKCETMFPCVQQNYTTLGVAWN